MRNITVVYTYTYFTLNIKNIILINSLLSEMTQKNKNKFL